MCGPESGWITVEETDDEAFAERIAAALRAAGIEMRVRRDAAGGAGGMVEVQVPIDRLDEALETLEPFDDVDRLELADGGAPAPESGR